MTKFYLILFLFISYGVAEAGDFEFAMPQPYKLPDVEAEIMYCTYGRCETACGQKMKEAMKLGDKYMPRDEQGLAGYTLEYCDPVCKAERELERVKSEQADLRKWLSIYRECVK